MSNAAGMKPAHRCRPKTKHYEAWTVFPLERSTYQGSILRKTLRLPRVEPPSGAPLQHWPQALGQAALYHANWDGFTEFLVGHLLRGIRLSRGGGPEPPGDSQTVSFLRRNPLPFTRLRKNLEGVFDAFNQAPGKNIPSIAFGHKNHQHRQHYHNDIPGKIRNEWE